MQERRLRIRFGRIEKTTKVQRDSRKLSREGKTRPPAKINPGAAIFRSK